MDTCLRVGALYPDMMNIYADRGNIEFLRRRCQMRGIGFELSAVGFGDGIDPDAFDLLYIGGGQDRDQALIADDLVTTKRDGLMAAAESDVVLLAVCGGYQLLGDRYVVGDAVLDGLGLIDLETVREDGPRLIGNVAIEVDIDGDTHLLAGFENHGGRTYLGATTTPLGRVIAGHGNNGEDGFEGAHWRNVFGTYLHGPLLPKNVWLADHLTTLALRHSAGSEVTLQPLDDRLEQAAHKMAIDVALNDRSNQIRRFRALTSRIRPSFRSTRR